jgi:FAD/FMN-containing dehydrogenase
MTPDPIPFLHFGARVLSDLSVHSHTASHRGSISAEHGIGVMKAHALHYSKGAVSREYMRRIKRVFDPKGILNPGKVIE